MRALRSALRPVSWWGWALVAVVLFGAAAGAWLSWRELILLSIAAAVLLISAVPWILRGRGVRVDLALSENRVAVGSPAFAVVTARRTGRLSLPNAVEVLLGDETIVVQLPRLARGGTSEFRREIDTSRRGRFQVGPVRIANADPLGILERVTVLSYAQEITVHPRTVRVPAISAGLVKDLEGEASDDLTADDVAFHSLREYQPGDDRRLVHWRTSARHGTLLVRQFDPSRRSETIVCLTTSPDEVGAVNFELALSVVATLGLAAMVERRPIRLLQSPEPGARAANEIDARGRDRLFDALTVLARDGRTGITNTVASLPRRSEAARVWLVVGAETSPRALREAIARVPVGVEPIVVRADDGAPPGIAKLGRVPVLTIGVLEDLVREMSHGAGT